MYLSINPSINLSIPTFIITLALHEVVVGVGLVDPEDPVDGVGRVP